MSDEPVEPVDWPFQRKHVIFLIVLLIILIVAILIGFQGYPVPP
jgi:hypothetical protein